MDVPGTGGAPTSAEDGELAALRAGDEAAFLELVDRYHGAMVRVASLYVKDAAAADEVVREAWAGVLRGLPAVDGRRSFRGWVFEVLVGCARSRVAREASPTPGHDEGQGPAVPPDRFFDGGARWAGNWSRPPSPWSEAVVASREMDEILQEALAALPRAQRAVMCLRDVDGWGAEEVSEVLGIPEPEQRAILHRARSRVRGHLERALGREEQA